MSDGMGFFIPEAHADRVRAAGAVMVPGVLNVLSGKDTYGFKIQGFLLRGRAEKLARLLRGCGLESQGTGFFLGRFRVCSIFSTFPEVVTRSSRGFIENRFSSELLEDAGMIFKQLSALTGRKVSVHAPRPQPYLIPSDDDSIHIIVNTAPPGECQKFRASTMCGVAMLGGKIMNHDGYALGYGGVVKDSDGVPIAQVIGNAYYLYLPLNPESQELWRESGAALLRKVLATAWNSTPEERTKASMHPLDTPEHCVDVFDIVSEEADVEFKQKIEELQADADAARKKYMDALAAIKLWGMLRESAAKRRLERKNRRTEDVADWQEVLAHPLTESLALVDEGFTLTTKPIRFEYEGTVYRLGSFTLRIALDGKLYAWSLDSPHSDGIPHPHISPYGSVCFGNLSLQLDEEVYVNRDFPRVFILLLDWIAEGYEPATALYKIEEWPKEES